MKCTSLRAQPRSAGPQLEQGILGGALLDFSEIGQKTAELTFRVLAGEMPPLLSPPEPALDPLLIKLGRAQKVVECGER